MKHVNQRKTITCSDCTKSVERALVHDSLANIQAA